MIVNRRPGGRGGLWALVLGAVVVFRQGLFPASPGAPAGPAGCSRESCGRELRPSRARPGLKPRG